MGTRHDQAAALASSASTPDCPQCGRPVVHTHRCPATPATSILHGPPAGWRDEVEAERRSSQLDAGDWEEGHLPLDPIADPPAPDRAPPP